MTRVITSPQPSRKIITPQEAPSVSKSTPIPPLVLGENLHVLVLSNSFNSKALLQIKNSTLLAHTPLPLQSGETLTVRVDQLHPMIVLRMILQEDSEISKSNEFLKLYRSNPGALREVITAVKDLFHPDHLKDFANYISKKDIQNVIKVLDKIIISKNNITKPLFLKDSIVALGLAGERRLMNALSDPTILADEQNSPTLKEILLKLSSKLAPIHVAGEYNEHDGLKVRQFSHFVDQALMVIESLQIVNILAMERDGLLVLQFPFQFQEGIRIQELFIETDRGKNEHEVDKEYRIVVFLDMDTLGELAVDAGIQGRTFQCTLKCSDQYVLDFMQTLLPELHETLSGLDYTIGGLQCVLDMNIQSWKRDFLQTHSMYSQSIIDVCA